jgi:hypothetical protein
MNGAGGGGTGGSRYRLPLYSIPEPVASRFFAPWLAQFGITNTAAYAAP